MKDYIEHKCQTCAERADVGAGLCSNQARITDTHLIPLDYLDGHGIKLLVWFLLCWNGNLHPRWPSLHRFDTPDIEYI